MASVSVLYLDDAVVAPHLELIRNVCEPTSKSRPHVTVRYFDRLPVPKEHLNTPVSYVDLVEPGSFGLMDGDAGPNRTVYIRCESEELLPLEHKPHYPASEFHITLYDGTSASFAEKLLHVMQTVTWGFRVQLPSNTTLTELQIRKKKKKKSSPTSRVYNPRLKALFAEATSEELSWPFLLELSENGRLELAQKIANHLCKATAAFPRVQAVGRRQPERNPHGAEAASGEIDVHLTPPELARDIAAYAVSLRHDGAAPVHFGDPAVGTGAFFAGLLQVLSRAQLESAIGIDINAKQVTAANWRWADKGMRVMHGDYFHMEKLPPRNLILANPPYLRHQGISPEYKVNLRARASVMAGIEVSGRSGLYVYFMLLSHAWMAPGAIAAWLIPSEFMQTDYGEALRYYLTHHVQLVRVHRFSHDHPQFESAKVLPAVVAFRNVEPKREREVMLSAGGSLDEPVHIEHTTVDELRHCTKWFVPQLSDDIRLSDVRLGDLFTISRGIATGANRFFILERQRANTLGIPSSALRPVIPKARALSGDVIERDGDGYPDTSPQLALIDCELPEDEIRSRFPRFSNYLDSAAEHGVLDRTLVKARRPWYRQEHREPPLFLCTYMGRGKNGSPPIRFIWNKSDAVATNTYLLLYPRRRLSEVLTDPQRIEELFELLQETAAVVGSRSRTHADGLHKVEPGDLAEIPLVHAPRWVEEAAEKDLVLGIDHR